LLATRRRKGIELKKEVAYATQLGPVGSGFWAARTSAERMAQKLATSTVPTLHQLPLPPLIRGWPVGKVGGDGLPLKENRERRSSSEVAAVRYKTLVGGVTR
jgi:hypothetical protein